MIHEVTRIHTTTKHTHILKQFLCVFFGTIIIYPCIATSTWATHRVLATLLLFLPVAYCSLPLLSQDDYTQVHQYIYGLPGHKTVILA